MFSWQQASPRRGVPTDPRPDHGRSMITDSKILTAEEAELAALIVQTLNLDVPASEVDPLGALYGDGLGLDSIDMLEIALVVSQHYGVKLRADDEDNGRIFGSLRSLNAFIQLHRPQ